MATLPELENALRKADAAGNVDDARALANAIRQMRAGRPDFGNVQAQSSKTVAERKRPAYAPNPIGITSHLADSARAFGHHLMAPLHGAAQLVEHGANSAANAILPAPPQTMSGLVAGERPQASGLAGVRQKINATVAADDEAMRQRESQYQAQTPDGFAANVGAVGGSVAPFVVGAPARALQYAGERIVAALPARTPQVLQRIASGFGQGGIIGATQPVLGEDYASEKGQQVAVAGATGGAIPAASGTLRGLANAAAPILAPQRVANSQLARLLDADGSSVAKLRNAPRFVPGEQPTTAQVLQSPRAAMAEKALGNRPDVKEGMLLQQNENNAARLGVLRRMAGSDEDMSAAIKARREEAGPFRAANLPEDGSAMVDAADVTASLEKLAKSANASVRAAANEHLSILRANAGPDGRVPAYALDDIRQNVGGMLAKHAPMGQVSNAETAKYTPISAQIIRSLDRAIPGYRDYLAAYRTNSAPINTMESARRILGPVDQRGLNTSGDVRLTLGQLNAGLNRVDKQRFGLTPEARGEVEGLRSSLQRESISSSVPSPGSDTAYNLASEGWLARQLYGPTMEGPSSGATGLMRLLGAGVGAHAAGPAGAAVGVTLPSVLKVGAERINQRIADRVAAGMRDPQEAARMIEQYLQQNRKDAPKLLEAYPQWAAMLGYDAPMLPPPR